MASATTDSSLIRELARRRVFLFLSVLTVIALLNALNEESDVFLHALDDQVIVLLSSIVIIFMAGSWKKQSPVQLRKQHNVITGIVVVAILFQIYAFVQEINDPADFGNEIPSLVLLVLTLLNRFV